MKKKFIINSDISKAETLPSFFYKNLETFEDLKSKIFLKSWQYIGNDDLIKDKNSVFPLTILENYLNEPIVLTKDEDNNIHCMTNVCTHREIFWFLSLVNPKNLYVCIMVEGLTTKVNLSTCLNLIKQKISPDHVIIYINFPVVKWGKLLFAGLNPSFDFQSIIDKMNERIGFLPIDQFTPDKTLSKDFTVNAHWALYCDNYLEGFHIPFVHKDLNEVLDYNNYVTEVYDHCNLQIGYSESDSDVFNFPENHPDYGKNVAAYYYWVFPNMMFNFYPWGLSLNIVKPISQSLTKVSFRSYVYDESKLNRGAGNQLQKVEEEDEFVVENVHNGLRSAFYKSGRFSPTREQGVHHFHKLISDFMNQ